MSDGIPESREYVHVGCGQITQVTGGDFKNVASPSPGVVKTMCSACGTYFPISEFKWEDTQEDIVSYYARYNAKVPAFIHQICSRKLGVALLLVGLLAGIAVGVWSGNALGILWGIVIGIVASLIGMLVGINIWDGMGHRALRRALGVPDVRCLK